MTFEIKELKPTKTGFGEGLKELGAKNANIIALGADITASVGMDLFAKEFPDRFFSMGIAEQNIAGVAAGLALDGKVPFFSTYGVFAALRTTDQIRVSICYNNLPVKIGGAHAGISVGPDGATHQALEDIAIMRVLPNMTVLSPCDANQTKLATIAAVEQVNGPCYIRFGREAVPNFTTRKMGFELGKGQKLIDGKDVSVIATGHMVWEGVLACEKLKNEGISAELINIHTIKPIDKDLILETARKTGAIVTVEEHQIIGGLGSAVAEIVCREYPVKMDFIGMNDCFGESGKPDELLDKYGLRAKNITESCVKLLEKQA
jgi:transketolase